MKKPDKTPTLPIYLDKNEDSIEHIRWLGDQRMALQEMQNNLLKYIHPLHVDLLSKQRTWWRRMTEKYNLDPKKSYALEGEQSPMPCIVELPPKDARPEANP